jgi:hypothetical protein
MLSARLVKIIEDHAEQLTRDLIDDLLSNSRTPHYHHLTREELHYRTYDVYRNLGRWLSNETEESIESSYTHLGKTRFAEGIPLSEVVYSLAQIKHHLQESIYLGGMIDSAVDLHGYRELQSLVGRFFDKAVYYTVKGFEHEADRRDPSTAVKHAAAKHAAF